MEYIRILLFLFTDQNIICKLVKVQETENGLSKQM